MIELILFSLFLQHFQLLLQSLDIKYGLLRVFIAFLQLKPLFFLQLRKNFVEIDGIEAIESVVMQYFEVDIWSQ